MKYCLCDNSFSNLTEYLSRNVCKYSYLLLRLVYVNVLCCRKIFDDCRDNLASYFKDREPMLWTFHPKIVFERFQAFLKRLETIKVLKSKETSNFMYNKAICSKKFLADFFHHHLLLLLSFLVVSVFVCF